jgi:hypothetical protein
MTVVLNKLARPVLDNTWPDNETTWPDIAGLQESLAQS